MLIGFNPCLKEGLKPIFFIYLCQTKTYKLKIDEKHWIISMDAYGLSFLCL